jgi:glycosyltransferase involved in cell wall biosynthesis
MRIHYLVPNRDLPSWGLAMIYQHVELLNKNGFDATIIKDAPLKPPKWINIDTPVTAISEFLLKVRPDDCMIVPEVMMDFKDLKKINCKKIVFIQAGGYIFESMPNGEDHISLGFTHAFIILPHLVNIIEKHIGLPYTIIPPFVAPYFFADNLEKRRKRNIVLYPKYQQIDHSIVNYLLTKHLRKQNTSKFKDFFKGHNWKIVELKNLAHKDVAVEMQESTFFVSLNTFEALNTSVVEAMAAGCIVFCYEGFGPRDYLADRENAFSFKNNEAYLLVENLCYFIDNYTENEKVLEKIRHKAFETAQKFSKEETEEKLLIFFKKSQHAVG